MDCKQAIAVKLRGGINKGIMTIKQAQIAVDEWIKSYGVRYFDELTNLAILMEEVGELARIMARTYGEQSFKNQCRLVKEKSFLFIIN